MRASSPRVSELPRAWPRRLMSANYTQLMTCGQCPMDILKKVAGLRPHQYLHRPWTAGVIKGSQALAQRKLCADER
jgi:hypothetical protein